MASMRLHLGQTQTVLLLTIDRSEHYFTTRWRWQPTACGVPAEFRRGTHTRPVPGA